MPPAVHEATPSSFSLDRNSNSIRFQRELRATPEQAFAAWTQPQMVECWWDPSGARLASCEIDLRVGGTFSFVSKDHPEMPFTGVYREISRPQLLEFEALGAIGRVHFSPAGAGTQMTVEIICSSPAHLEQFIEMGVAGGTSQTLDNLVALLGSQDLR